MKTEARLPARTLSGWTAIGDETETNGCGSGAIGTTVRDPRPSGCPATGIAAMTAGFGSMAVGKIVTMIMIMLRHHRHRFRKSMCKTDHPRNMSKKFHLLPARTFSG
jgi:hypothetical protein